MTGHSYCGPALDGTVQYITESPFWGGDGETVDVVDDEPIGEDVTENVPSPDDDRRPNREGQTTLEDYGWSP
ncbi:hypothetical protein [Halobacterium wangiae]|uniref:hypothetical protein n=1 Tax=Halobacterium wangiae TaxID=2902623 RepID=UPI001E4C6FCA|nr:hypothetical protein [Halobacterium wangiae]